jgi:hypothetical protein
MGLDLSFDAEAFKKIEGVEFTTLANGTEEELAHALKYSSEESDYIDWLKERTNVLRIPGHPYWRDYDEHNGLLFIRANKWGDFYTPLTELLKEHDITWEEF